MPDLVPGVARAISPLVRRILAPNPGVFTGPGTNTYLVGIDEVVVIDPGPDLGEDTSHLDAIVGCGSDRIRWVVCTHTHPDHSPATAALKERTGAEVLAFSSTDNLTVDRAVGDGFVLEGTEFRLRALHTPGHASNHLCFLLEAEQLLFSGDHIMNGSTVVIRPPDGDMAVYLDQLERLRTLRLRAIAPGHGDVIDEPIAKVDEYLTHRRAREAKVLDRLRRADTATVADLVPSVYDDVPEERHWIAASSLWAHLRKLAADGLVTSSDVDADDSTWCAA
ncbi:MAG TPA: MBL fold metallo-hydrolase [Acidimicrobiales bacterium]|nr:MBL fold metallo-hydrolase [Acidimicrobiales bacterium]